MKNNIYEDSYFKRGNYGKAFHSSKYFLFLQKYIKDLEFKNILDLGCAQGLFLVNNKNPKSVGIDISEYAIKEAIKKDPGKKYIKHDMNDNNFPLNARFDVITMFDIIEHLYSFIGLKNILNKNLKKNGYLVITTPNTNSIIRFFKKESFTGEIDETHTILFTPYIMDFFLKRMGLKKIELFTPYSFYYHDNILTQNLCLGGQIFAIYKK